MPANRRPQPLHVRCEVATAGGLIRPSERHASRLPRDDGADMRPYCFCLWCRQRDARSARYKREQPGDGHGRWAAGVAAAALGLLRGGSARFQGAGPKKAPHRGTADDVLLQADLYVLQALAQHPGAAGRTLVWDNASSHGAQGTKAAGKVQSVFDRLSSWQWGLGTGEVYLPAPRSPADLNPIETAFA